MKAKPASNAAAPRRWLAAVAAGLWVAFYWAMYYPQPYGLAVGLQLVLPLLAVGVWVRFSRQEGFDDKAIGSSSAVGLAFILPIIAVAYRGLTDFSLLDWSRFWIPCTALTLLMGAALRERAPGLGKRLKRMAVVLPFCFAYSYGLLVHVNCHYDDSWPAAFEARVRHHDISRGKSVTRYYLIVNPWLGQPVDRRVMVSREVYQDHPDNGSVQIGVHRGLLGYSWFSVQ
jgi:hypothetical protein